MDDQLTAAATQRLEWRDSHRYDYNAVDLYDPSRGSGTYSGPCPQSQFRSAAMAADVARAMNGAYRQGVLRGRGELLREVERIAHDPNVKDPAAVAVLLAILATHEDDTQI